VVKLLGSDKLAAAGVNRSCSSLGVLSMCRTVTIDGGSSPENVDRCCSSLGVLSMGPSITTDGGSFGCSALAVTEGPGSSGQLKGEDCWPIPEKGAVGCCSGPGAVENVGA